MAAAAAFDPDAYLANAAPPASAAPAKSSASTGGFDPDAYLRQKSGNTESKPSALDEVAQKAGVINRAVMPYGLAALGGAGAGSFLGPGGAALGAAAGPAALAITDTGASGINALANAARGLLRLSGVDWAGDTPQLPTGSQAIQGLLDRTGVTRAPRTPGEQI